MEHYCHTAIELIVRDTFILFKLRESEYCFCVSYVFWDEISNGSAAYNSCSGTAQHYLDRDI